MRNKGIRHLLLAVVLSCSLSVGSAPAQMFTVSAATADTKKQTTVTEKKSAYTGWKKEKAGYCYYVKGKKLTNQQKKIGGKYYYLGSDGVRKTGWYTVKMASKGKTVYKAMKFSASGVYTGKFKIIDSNLMKKTDTIIKNCKISTSLSSVAKQKAALKKLYTYVKKYDYARAPLGVTFTGDKVFDYAAEIMTLKKGSCYHYASAFAVLAKRATGLPVKVCWGNSNAFNEARWSAHAWVEIKIGSVWYTYDPNAEKFSTRKNIKWYQSKAASMKKTYQKQGSFEITL